MHINATHEAPLAFGFTIWKTHTADLEKNTRLETHTHNLKHLRRTLKHLARGVRVHNDRVERRERVEKARAARAEKRRERQQLLATA